MATMAAANASALLVGGRPLDCDAQARRGDCRNSNHHMMARFCPGHCKPSGPPPLEDGWCDFQDGQRFRCRPLVPPAEDLAARIRRTHPGDRVLCLLLLTKDDWPTVRSSVLHHGHLVGFEHLYVLDGSTESSEAVAFLQRARSALGVNVLRTTAGLNTVGAELQRVAAALASKDACDFVTKLDTDEFLDTYKGSAELSLARAATPAEFRAALNALPLDGRSYVVPWVAGAHPPQVPAARCLDDSYDVAVDATRFDWGPWKVPFGRSQEPRWVKTIASAATFGQLDLGSHDWFGTMSRPPYGTRPKIEAPLMAYHFHLTCFERTLKRDAVAAISHGYIAAGDDDATRARKLRAIVECKGDKCPVVSTHKVARYLRSLVDFDAAKRAYYSGGGAVHRNRSLAFARHIEEITREYAERLHLRVAPTAARRSSPPLPPLSPPPPPSPPSPPPPPPHGGAHSHQRPDPGADLSPVVFLLLLPVIVTFTRCISG